MCYLLMNIIYSSEGSETFKNLILRIHINNHEIELTDYVRFLRVFIDSR